MVLFFSRPKISGLTRTFYLTTLNTHDCWKSNVIWNWRYWYRLEIIFLKLSSSSLPTYYILCYSLCYSLGTSETKIKHVILMIFRRNTTSWRPFIRHHCRPTEASWVANISPKRTNYWNSRWRSPLTGKIFPSARRNGTTILKKSLW